MLSEKRVKLLDVDTPPQITIKPSLVNPDKHGIWCREEIKTGSKYGPYTGEKAYEVDDSMDPAYIWEIVDVETKEFLFYINASNPRHSNWMRFINCARYLEEQNIVSQQEGIDIYYHAIKDIKPGEELLTWYEKSPVRKKKGKKKIGPIAVKRAQTGSEIKALVRSSEVSMRGRKRVVRKIWKEEEEREEEDKDNEDEEGDDDEESENEVEDVDDDEWSLPKHGGISMATTPATLALRSGPLNTTTANQNISNKNMGVVKRSGSAVSNVSSVGSVRVSTGNSSRYSLSSRNDVIINRSNIIMSSSGLKSTQVGSVLTGKILTSSMNNSIRNNTTSTINSNRNLSKNTASTSTTLTKRMVRSQTDTKASDGRLSMLLSLKLPPYSSNNKVSNTNTLNIITDSKISSGARNTHHQKTTNDAKPTANAKSLNINLKNTSGLPNSSVKNNTVMTPIVTTTPTLKTTITTKTPVFFNFEQMVEQTPPSALSYWKAGRKMFRCDICAGEYKHSFSLKRHYVRSHIAFKYLNHVDVLSCGVTTPKDLEDNVSLDVTSLSNEDNAGKSDSVIKPVVVRTTNKQIISQTGTTGSTNSTSLSGLYRCNLCDCYFDVKVDLQVHWKEHENSDNNTEKNFNCSSCKMTFRHKQNLLRHELTHTGAKPFSCHQCHKTFPTATNQKRHERIHVGHRLTCYICSATFTQAGDLKKHTCKQHPESYNECAYCTKYFVTELSLVTHLKEVHSKDIEANRKRVCVKKKARKMLLERDRAESRRLAVEEMENKHRRTTQNFQASSDETYACTVCRKVFQNYSNMCRHRRLAHFRDGSDQPWNKLEEMFDESYFDDENNLKEEDPSNAGVVTKAADKFESLQSYFFKVSGNITLNLESYLEGTQDQINNASNHIRWKQRNGARMNGVRGITTPLCDLNLEELNFPRGFEIPEKLEYIPVKSTLEIVDDCNLALGENKYEVEMKDDVEGSEDAEVDLTLFNHPDSLINNNSNLVSSNPLTNQPNNFDDINIIHDYSKKPHLKPTPLKSHQVSLQFVDSVNLVDADETVLDLSKHIKCAYSDSKPPHMPCSVPLSNEEEGKMNRQHKEYNKPQPIKPNNDSLIKSPKTPSNEECGDNLHGKETNLKKFICLVCYDEFVSKTSVLEHQDQKHCYVDSRHLEVEKDFVVTWIKTPNPIGQLNVTSSILPLTEIEEEDEEGDVVISSSPSSSPSSSSILTFSSTPSSTSLTPFTFSVSNISSKVTADGSLESSPKPVQASVTSKQEVVINNDMMESIPDTNDDADKTNIFGKIYSQDGKMNLGNSAFLYSDISSRTAPTFAVNSTTTSATLQPYMSQETVKNTLITPKTIIQTSPVVFSTITKPSTFNSTLSPPKNISFISSETTTVITTATVVTTSTLSSSTTTSPTTPTKSPSSKKAHKTCTKCRQAFRSRSELHKHISDECGDYWRNLKDRVSWVFVLRGTELPAITTQGTPDKKRGKYRGNGVVKGDSGMSEEGYKRQLQKMLVQQHIGDDGEGLLVGRASLNSKVMTRRRSQEIGGSVMRAFDDPDFMVRARRKESLMNNAANKKLKTETDVTPELVISEVATVEEEEEEDDGFEYDPHKHMCIYCRHQFLYVRTLRKHVKEFCHVRKEFKEKGETLDPEWEDGLHNAVHVATGVDANNDGEDGRKNSSGGIRKKRRKNWTNVKNNKNNKQTPNNNKNKTTNNYSNQSSYTSSSHSPDILAPPSFEFPINQVSDSIQKLVRGDYEEPTVVGGGDLGGGGSLSGGGCGSSSGGSDGRKGDDKIISATIPIKTTHNLIINSNLATVTTQTSTAGNIKDTPEILNAQKNNAISVTKNIFLPDITSALHSNNQGKINDDGLVNDKTNEIRTHVNNTINEGIASDEMVVGKECSNDDVKDGVIDSMLVICESDNSVSSVSGDGEEGSDGDKNCVMSKIKDDDDEKLNDGRVIKNRENDEDFHEGREDEKGEGGSEMKRTRKRRGPRLTMVRRKRAG